LRHFLDGIQFALGDLPVDTTPLAFDVQTARLVTDRLFRFRFEKYTRRESQTVQNRQDECE